nr:HNH endonuclease [Providencia rettgeri]
MIQARIGQGRYRKSLLKLWGNKCAVTGVGDSELLIASHIVAWTISSPKEKVDPYNGFPLTPNLDKLFDLGLISFDDNGQILVKKKIEKSLKILNLSKELKLRHVFEQNIRYLKKHRELFKFD